MRILWNSGGNYKRYEYTPDHRLLRATREWDGTVFEFAHHDDGQVFTLHYDQIASLRAVADHRGNVIQETLYDPFGGIIESTNPALRIPLGFAGALHDRDLGFVRFGWRDKSAGQRIWTLRSSATPRRGEGQGRPESL
ncbi:MAG: hypothetical protein KUA35_11095 [Pseudodesulfovibrio sp.]|uniref:Teneurin-like YD-shell domain-containing protein n=1 Tax=Pseudodesulfovibrio aespoeensis (strain ATCC 700646 / DSM 10631 / Aspo-2) TaxID=643562 RepID=E6VTZ6_PSEA9|nr:MULTISPECIES: hypothetical protein [Pseudodesulfovibrio]ADU61088.1 hypothetical protein Daes_0059 [Pseudodesulfovibrio aespoeensis Aspo-2]MBU4379306.1 hypothetical protein [Pseudomonadota bacterium]MBV1772956.1 hypothetical protein [Pseudodesulfovibrio sp.]MCG2733145.1 hypothetical protein [Pseudodesulfovibrio aespoeensis]